MKLTEVNTGDIIVDSTIEVLFDDMEGRDHLDDEDVEDTFRFLAALCREEPQTFDCAGYVLQYVTGHHALTRKKAEAALEFIGTAKNEHPNREQRIWLEAALTIAQHTLREIE